MNVRLMFFLCTLESVFSKIPSPQAYYGKHFLEFTTGMRQDNMILETIFQNLKSIKQSSELCYFHLETYRNSLRNNTYWAMNYLDSSGSSLQPGWLTGNTINLGAFDECVSPKVDESFRGNFCWLIIQLNGEKSQLLGTVPHNNPVVFTVCVPHSCTGKDLSILTEPMAKRMNFSVQPQCQEARPSMTTLDYVSLCFFVFVGLFTISTIIPTDCISLRNTRFWEFWRCFDLYGNVRALSLNSKGENILASLYGIRFLSQCCIVWIHVVFNDIMSLNPVQNKFIFNDHYRSWYGAFKKELNLAVDTFFLLGGTVISYNCLRRKTQLNLPKYYFHRYLRLTPALMAVLLLVMTFNNKLCTGPLCLIKSDGEHYTCGKYWWASLLYINNFYPNLGSTCLVHTWYLACDWQLFIFVSPFVVTVINKKPQHIYKLLTFIFTSSLIYSAVITVIYNLQFDPLQFERPEDSEAYIHLHYATPMVRAGPWAVGMFLGVILHHYNGKSDNLSKKTIIFCWSVCAVLLVSTTGFSILPLTQEDSNPSVWARAAFLTFNRNLFALAVAWIVFACSVNVAGPIGKILSAPMFEPLGKLSYSMYLIHFPIVYLYTGSVRTPSYFSTMQQVPIILGLIVASSFAGFLLYLTFEAPVMQIEKLIFRKGKTRDIGPPAQSTV